MFRFIKQYAETMNQAGVFPVIGLIIFFAFFVGLLLYVRKMDKKTLSDLSNMPLENEPNTTNN